MIWFMRLGGIYFFSIGNVDNTLR